MTSRIKDKIEFPEKFVDKVWEKGETVPGLDPAVFRKDKCSALIKRELYRKAGEILSMAWEIDRIKPRSHGGTDELSNLQPLQWKNKKHKKDNYPSWSCMIGSEKNKNNLLKK